MGTHSNLVLTVSGKKYVFFYQYDGNLQYEVFVNDILELFKKMSYSDVRQEFKKLKAEKVEACEADSPNGISWILDLGYIPYVENLFEGEQYILRVNFDRNLVEFESSHIDSGSSHIMIVSKKISEITEDDLECTGKYIDKIMRKYNNLKEKNSEQFKNLSRTYESVIDILRGYEAGEGITTKKVSEPPIEKLGYELLRDGFWREYVDGTLKNSRLFRFDEKNLNPNYVYITGLRIAGRPDILRKIPDLKVNPNTFGKSFYDVLNTYGVIYTAAKILKTGKDEKVFVASIDGENDEYWLDVRETTMDEALKYCNAKL